MSKSGYSAAREKRLTEGRIAANESWFDAATATVAKSSALNPLIKLKTEGADIEKVVKEVSGTSRAELPGRQLALDDRVPTTLPDEVDALVSGDHDAGNVAGWLWGAALARICSDDNGTGMMLEAGWNLASCHDVSTEAFLAGLSEAYVSNYNEFLLKGIRAIAHKIKSQPEECVYNKERDRFRQALEEWEKESNFPEVWEFRLFQYFPFHCDSAGVLDVLRRSAPEQYLALLDEIRLPPVTENALRLIDVAEDLQAILDLLALAPPVTTGADGEVKWNGKIGAAYLLNAALDYAIQLSRAFPHSEEAETAEKEKELADVFTEIASVLLERQDGIFLAIHWMCHLIRSQRQRPYQSPNQAIAAIPGAIEALAAALHSRGIALANFEEIFPQLLNCDRSDLKSLQLQGLGDLDRYSKPAAIDVFWAALRVHTASYKSEALTADEAYFEAFHSVLIRQDGGLYLQAPESHSESHLWLLALMYAMDEKPCEKWLTTWKLLAEQRRVFQHKWPDDRAMWAQDPSFYVANIGLLLVDWLISPDLGKGEDAARVFRAVFDTVLNMAISPPAFKNDRWQHLLANLFSRQPHLVEGEEGGIVAGRQLARLGGDYALSVWCLANSLLNGVDIGSVTSEFESQNELSLTKMLEDFVFWESRESNRRPNLKLIEEAHNILSQISGAREEH